jgi:hypothetical protein
MIRLALVAAAILVASGVAWADDLPKAPPMKPIYSFSFSDSGPPVYDWPAIEKCASLPLPGIKDGDPGMNNMLSWQWKTMENKFRQINICRSLMAARRAGYEQAKSGEPEPAVIPMMRPDDMKVFCRFESHLDANGAGWTECWLPGETP